MATLAVIRTKQLIESANRLEKVPMGRLEGKKQYQTVSDVGGSRLLIGVKIKKGREKTLGKVIRR